MNAHALLVEILLTLAKTHLTHLMCLNHLLQKKMSEIRGRIKMSKDFQNKYVGYMLLSLVLGVVGIGVIGLIYFATTGGY